MEKAYKTVLEIILNLCEQDSYRNTSDIKMMCKTVLGIKSGETESGGEDVRS